MGIYHIELHVRNLEHSTKFYDLVLTPLGFRRFMTMPDEVGYTDGRESIFLAQAPVEFLHHGFHRKRIGLNHIAFRVGSKKEVEKFYREVLLPNKLWVIYGGPAEYPEYHAGYYAVYFEDPDRIKLEVVYTTEPVVHKTPEKEK